MRRPSGFEEPVQPDQSQPRKARTSSKRSQRHPAQAHSGHDQPAQRRPAQRQPVKGRAAQKKQQAAPGRTEQGNAAPKRPARAEAAALRAQQRAARSAERDELRRFTRGLRHRRRVLAAVLLSGVFLVALLLVGLFSPLFAVRAIEVRGTGQLDAAQVQEALEGQLGIPLPLVRSAQIAEALEQFPQIESFVTESRLPDTLLVRIVERTPIAVIRDGSGFAVVDAAGVTLRSGAERFEALPLLRVGEEGVDGAGFDAAVRVLRSLPEPLLESIDELTASTLDDVTFSIRGGAQTVRWGSAADSALKAEVLAALLQRHTDPGLSFDVSSPTMPVVG